MSSLQLAAASYIYIHYTLEKRAAVVAKATVHKQGTKCTAVQVCWQT
jgi:hypothetical protein